MYGLLLPVSFLLALQQVAAQTTTDSYAPQLVTCPPSNTLLRRAGTVAQGNQTLSPAEQSYIQRRKQGAVSTWQSYLSARNIGYSASSFNASTLPTVAIAVSGGGYRAALYGAGALSALDSRNSTGASAGTGGVLQLATYLSGLSGGSWMVSSLAIHDMPTLTDLVLGSATTSGWQLQYNLLLPDSPVLGILNNGNYYDDLQDDVDLKEQAGFNTSITDVWGRALSYHFAPGTVGGSDEAGFYNRENATSHAANLNWGQIRQTSSFQNASMPFPIIVADSVLDNQSIAGDPYTNALVYLNQTVFEFNPYEFGSFDAYLAAFSNLTYLGTRLINGSPLNSSSCAIGFQNFGFLIGTSSSLFIGILNTINGYQVSGVIQAAIQAILSRLTNGLSMNDNDVSNYPNPFQGINPGTFARSPSAQLQLVDGGLNGENVPLGPLLQPARAVDVILALDGSADTTENWPNGTSLITTYNRTQLPGLSYSMPQVPLQMEEFVSQGYNVRPVFFGCNISSSESYPLIIYMPNAPTPGTPEYTTNTTTFTLDYSVEEAAAFLAAAQESTIAGFVENKASAANGTRDSDWPNALACAMMDRSRARAGIARSSVCSAAFSRYCYTGSTAATTTSTSSNVKSSASIYKPDVAALVIATAGMLGWLL